MDLKEYFQRIGFSGPADKADFDTLCKIHKLHIMTIPFENLSIQCGESIAIGLEVVYNKLVRSKRGGGCSENNLLFSWVLREMGYAVTTLAASCFDSVKNDFDPMVRHFINKVDIDGTSYITDVSYGGSGQIWQPIEMISGKDQPQAPGIFCLKNVGEMWLLQKTGRKLVVKNEDLTDSHPAVKSQTKNIYRFCLTPRDADYFLETKRWLWTNPDSLFTKKSICSLQTPSGYRVLVGWTYSEITYNYEKGTDVLEKRYIPDEEITTVLEEKFNVVLTKAFVPIDKKTDLKFE